MRPKRRPHTVASILSRTRQGRDTVAKSQEKALTVELPTLLSRRLEFLEARDSKNMRVRDMTPATVWRYSPRPLKTGPPAYIMRVSGRSHRVPS